MSKKHSDDYRKKTAVVLNELIRDKGLDSYLGKLSEDTIGIKLILTISVVIGAASLLHILVKMAILLLSAPYVVYIVIVTVAFCLYLMIKIENQEVNDVSDNSEEKEKEIKKEENVK